MGCCRLTELKRAERADLLDKLTRYPLAFDGHEGYAKVPQSYFHPACPIAT